jgi:hypothetical protein
MIQESTAWRAEYFGKGPLSDETVAEDIKVGIVYFCGRDYALRPLMVVRANRIPKKWYQEGSTDKVVRLLIFHMEYLMRYMIVPGRVENIVVMIDLAGLGISDVPISALGKVYSVLNRHYGGRLYRCYIYNLSWGLKTLSSAVMNLVTDRQKQKLCILSDEKALQQDFTANFAAHQLEKDLGGSREALKEFLPFPMPPGPFEKGYTGEPQSDAIPYVHKVMTPAGFMGRLWDVTKSEEYNQKVQYEADAADLLRQCGVPVPPELLPRARSASNLAKATSTEGQQSMGIPPKQSDSSPFADETDQALVLPDPAAEFADDNVIFDPAVSSGSQSGFWCTCMPQGKA